MKIYAIITVLVIIMWFYTMWCHSNCNMSIFRPSKHLDLLRLISMLGEESLRNTTIWRNYVKLKVSTTTRLCNNIVHFMLLISCASLWYDWWMLAGVDRSNLIDTFASYSRSALAGGDEFGKKSFPVKSFSPAYTLYTCYITPVIHYTMGGMKVHMCGCSVVYI